MSSSQATDEVKGKPDEGPDGSVWRANYCVGEVASSARDLKGKVRVRPAGRHLLLEGKVRDRPAGRRPGGLPHSVKGARPADARSGVDPQQGDAGVMGGGTHSTVDPQAGECSVVLDDNALSQASRSGIKELEVFEDAVVLHRGKNPSLLGPTDAAAAVEPTIRILHEVLAQGDLNNVNTRHLINIILRHIHHQGALHDPHTRQQINTMLHESAQRKQLGSLEREYNPAPECSKENLDVLGVHVDLSTRFLDELLMSVHEIAAQGLLQHADFCQILEMLHNVLNNGLLLDVDARLQFTAMVRHLGTQRKHELDMACTSAGVDTEPAEVQNCLAGATPEIDEVRSMTHMALISSKTEIDKMQDARYVYLNYTWGIHNNHLVCMVMSVVVFNSLMPLMPLPDLSMDDPVALVLRTSLLICSQLFLLILPIWTATSLLDIFTRVFFGPLLAFATVNVVSPLTRMTIAHLSTAWVAGLFGYSFAEYRHHVGTGDAASVTFTPNQISLSETERMHRKYTQIHSVFHSGVAILSLGGLMVWLLSLQIDDHSLYYAVWAVSVLAWWIMCFGLALVSPFMFHKPLISERTVSYYLASFPISIPFVLISQVLWMYLFSLEMMFMASYFGYMLAIYVCYSKSVAEGGEQGNTRNADNAAFLGEDTTKKMACSAGENTKTAASGVDSALPTRTRLVSISHEDQEHAESGDEMACTGTAIIKEEEDHEEVPDGSHSENVVVNATDSDITEEKDDRRECPQTSHAEKAADRGVKAVVVNAKDSDITEDKDDRRECPETSHAEKAADTGVKAVVANAKDSDITEDKDDRQECPERSHDEKAANTGVKAVVVTLRRERPAVVGSSFFRRKWPWVC